MKNHSRNVDSGDQRLLFPSLGDSPGSAWSASRSQRTTGRETTVQELRLSLVWLAAAGAIAATAGCGSNFGGAGNDEGFGVAVDSAGNVYVTGATASTNFPTTAGALQTAPGGGFVFKIDPPAGGGQASPLAAVLSSSAPVIDTGASGGGLNAHSPSAAHAQSATAGPVTGSGPDVFQTDLSTLLTDSGTLGDWPSDQEAGWSPSDLAFL